MNTTCLIVMTNLTHAVLQAGVNYVLASAVHMVIHFQKVTITQALFPFPLTIYNLVRCTTISCEHPDSIEWLKKPFGLFGGIHLLQMKKRIVCDKEPKLVCSEVQWTEELDITFHRVLIRGTFQRVPAASEGLFKAELSETHQYSLRAVCLLSIPQLTSGELTSNGLQLALKRVPMCKINCTHLVM